MNRLLSFIIAFTFCLGSSSAQIVQSPPFGAGQIPGTTTNDNATAGNVGQTISSVCPGGTSTITVTVASPAVVTYTTHGFVNNTTTGEADACPIVFTNSGGALPTGITSGTTYFTIPSSITTNTFQIATTVANALAGTAVNTSGSQSGTHTGTKGVAFSTGTAVSITGITLTPGDWDVWASAGFTGNSATNITILRGEISATDNTENTTIGFITTQVYGTSGAGAVVFGSDNPIFPIGPVRISVSSSTNYFLVDRPFFSVNTCTGFGTIQARRRR